VIKRRPLKKEKMVRGPWAKEIVVALLPPQPPFSKIRKWKGGQAI